MIKFLQDSYNGIYKIVLKPYMPSGKLLLTLVVGVLIGLLWAYAVAPTTYIDGDPLTLEQSWQNEWVKMLADRNAAANFDVSSNIIDLLARIDDPLGALDALIASPGEAENVTKLQAIRPFAEAAQPLAADAPQEPGLLGNIQPWIVGPLVVTILFIIFALLYGILLKPNLVDPIIRRLRGKSTSKNIVEERKVRAEQAKLLETQKTDYTTTTGLGKPLLQRMSTYRSPGPSFDESYEIQNDQENFLGECGCVVAAAINHNGATLANSFDIWLFDKDDLGQTPASVYAIPYAYNDPAVRAQLAERGDVVLMQPGAIIMLETSGLRLQARVVEMEYAQGTPIPNSALSKTTFELAAWSKKGAAGTGGTPMMQATPVYQQPAVPTYAPPAAPPTPTYVPPSDYGAYPPIPPSPPMPPSAPGRAAPLPEDDDPFGGTGDFKPLR